MAPQEIEKYFQYHNANIKLIKIGFDNIRNQIKRLYRSVDINGNYIFSLNDMDQLKAQQRQIEKSLFRILSGIQVSWAEESIKRLFYEKGLFTDAQRDYLIRIGSLDQKWYETLKIVFSIAYDLVPAGDEICASVNINRQKRNLGVELVAQYFGLRRMITEYLVPNFSIRNKVQHGEWVYAFKPKHSIEFSQDTTNKLDHENIITTTSRFTLVNALYQMIVDMGRFKSNAFAIDSMLTPFEYFYDDYIRKIKFEVTKIESPDLPAFIEEIIAREVRGKLHRASNQQAKHDI
ncbi:hypothetical protein [Sphingobacterium sp. HMA12]|uniref:hypothetical protein n=1 Tax=Sphingobacterium sp. HMA12 TaxID=2050894 RepID=UPI000CEA4926|nr:hypothetical protein [Sphingobacterium sp. HMA12]